MDGAGDVTTTEQLAALLRALRRRHARAHNDRELTVREIAAKSGYAVGRVSEYLNGVTLPPTDRFDVLIGIFGATKAEQAALATARDRVEEARRGTRRPDIAPMQLPPDVHDFAGRHDELATLGESPISVVTGPEGVGKTALAVKWAHQAADRFRDGVLYLELGSYDVEKALASLLRGLGTEVPDELNERTALWRTTVARRRVLLVLDNARDADQVVPLLPGSGPSVVVVTSRNVLNDLVVRYNAQRFVLVDVDAREQVRAWIDEHWQDGVSVPAALSLALTPYLLEAGRVDACVRMLADLGLEHNRAGRFEEALEVLERARDLYAEVEDHAGRGAVLASLGVCYEGLNRREEAIAVTYKALALQQAIEATSAAEHTREILRSLGEQP